MRSIVSRRIPFGAAAALGLAFFLPASPAHAVSKEIIQLQTQVQALQDILQQMQRSNSEQLGVLQHLVEQSTDNINRINQQVTALGAKVDQESQNNQVSGQIQGLNDSVDELKSRLGKIDSSLAAIQSQLQNVQSQPAPAGGAPTPDAAAPAPPSGNGVSVPLGGGTQTAPGPQATANPQGAPPSQPQQAQAPPVDQLYQGAVRDYNSAKYDLATSEFADVVKFYPGSDQAGNASFYLGEISYRQGLYPAAIKSYDAVLEQYPGSPKAPTAQLRKAEAELASSQHDAGVRDLRALVGRYPMTPEGAQGRSLLNGMGIRLSANKPSPYQH